MLGCSAGEGRGGGIEKSGISSPSCHFIDRLENTSASEIRRDAVFDAARRTAAMSEIGACLVLSAADHQSH